MIAELTLSNLKSYAHAAETLALKLLDLEREGFTTMVVPSRGAAPFERWARAYFHTVWKPALQTRNERLEAQIAQSKGPMINPLYLPFTADIGDGEISIESRDIRRYWSAVLAAMVRGDYQDPFYRFFDFLRAEVCATTFPHRHDYTALPSRFIFLDTVVSGRAVAEIMAAFDEFHLQDCHFILIVDANGARLRRPYADTIDAAVRAGRATRIDVDRLFTEDQGPAVSGIWSVVMPEFMEIARNEIPAFSASGAVGAGLYYTEVRAREDKTNLSATIAIGTLARLVPMLWSPFMNDAWIEDELDQLRKHLKISGLTQPEATLDLAEPRLIKASKAAVTVGISSSHALRLHMPKDEAARKVAALRHWISPISSMRAPEFWTRCDNPPS